MDDQKVEKKKLLKCQFCEKVDIDVIRYHQRTAYADEKMNWVNACSECKKVNDKYWNDMWNQYYSGCM